MLNNERHRFRVVVPPVTRVEKSLSFTFAHLHDRCSVSAVPVVGGVMIYRRSRSEHKQVETTNKRTTARALKRARVA